MIKNTYKKTRKSYLLIAIAIVASQFTALLSAAFPTDNSSVFAASVNVKQVSTGKNSACAVVDGWVKCWGSNQYGQLGDGSIGGSQSSPQTVIANKNAIPATTRCAIQTPVGCFGQIQVTPEIPASPMVGKYIEKVSVGTTHACALANASVFCWGGNGHGQLGNRSYASTMSPVLVDTQSKITPKSALAQKEVIDIAAGDNFTCALSSDGNVACWGDGANGRLGTNRTINYNIPTSVYNQTGSAFNGKKGIKLAKAAGATMCVLAVDSANISGATSGNAYCWGYGIDDGSGIPRNSSTTTTCGAGSPTTAPITGTTSQSVVFESAAPVRIPGEVFTALDGNDYVTALTNSGQARYWGRYGYVRTDTISNVSSCAVTMCVANTGARIQLASVSTDKAKANNQPGADKNKNLNSNTTSSNSASQTANQYNPNGRTSSSSGYSGSTSSSGSYSGVASPGYNPAPSANVGNNNRSSPTTAPSSTGGGRSTPLPTSKSTPTPAPTPVPTTTPIVRPPTPNPSDKKTTAPTPTPAPTTAPTPTPAPTTAPTPTPAPQSCKQASVTHYGYSQSSSFSPTGKNASTVPAATTLTQSNLRVQSGNVYNDLYCAANSNGTYCDTNGTSISEGQTGSDYTKECTTVVTYQVFKTTTCAPPPTGPQQVKSDGWLSGKTLNTLDTGTSGYTCAIASGSVGCWGINNNGQLGTGDTNNRFVPTSINV